MELFGIDMYGLAFLLLCLYLLWVFVRDVFILDQPTPKPDPSTDIEEIKLTINKLTKRIEDMEQSAHDTNHQIHNVMKATAQAEAHKLLNRANKASCMPIHEEMENT